MCTCASSQLLANCCTKAVFHPPPCSPPPPDIIPFKECEVIIFKGHQVLGLIIAGGTDSLLDGIYIQKIIPGSPADKDGRLKPGDKILRIDNSSMEGVSRDEALRALQRSPSFVRLTVVRDPHNAPTMPSYKEEGIAS